MPTHIEVNDNRDHFADGSCCANEQPMREVSSDGTYLSNDQVSIAGSQLLNRLCNLLENQEFELMERIERDAVLGQFRYQIANRDGEWLIEVSRPGLVGAEVPSGVQWASKLEQGRAFFRVRVEQVTDLRPILDVHPRQTLPAAENEGAESESER